MDKSEKETQLFLDSELEDARIGYEAAISMVTNLVNIIWSIFNTMLVANSIVVAGISLILSNQPSNPTFKVILSIIGLVICLMWFQIAKRHRDYLVYYMLSAREIEEKYLSQNVKTLSRGGIFARGKEVTLNINGVESTRRMSFWSRSLRGEIASYIIIFVFAAIYISILII